MKQLKARIRNWILSNHPEWYAIRIFVKTYNYRSRYTKSDDHEQLPKELKQDEVLVGPFKGLKYTVEAIWSEKYPKILGTYEKELFPYIDQLETGKYEQIINIGAAEGFFGTALAWKLNIPDLYFVDPLKESHSFSSKLAVDNGREVKGHLHWISPAGLNKLIGKKNSLIFMDCEGGESAYLDPALVPNIARCDVLVETHDFLMPGLSDRISELNSRTHEVVKLNQQKRDLSDLDPLGTELKSQLPEAKWRDLMNEHRPKRLHWLVMMTRGLN